MKKQDLICILFSGLGLILVFPPFPIGLIATITLVPFFFFLEGKTGWEAFWGGYMMGFLWTGGTLYWIGWATIPGLIGALIYLPVYSGLFGLIMVWFSRKWRTLAIIAAPILWTGIEIISSFGPLGFPWNALGNSQSYTPQFIQFGSIVGVHGISFWILSINSLFYFFIKKWRENRFTWKLGAILILFFMIPWAYGLYIFSHIDNSKESLIKVTLIQGNIDPYREWTPGFVDSSFITYRRLTHQVALNSSDIIIWPETASPCYLRYRRSCYERVKSKVDSLQIPILLGSPDYEWVNRQKANVYNAALIVRPESYQVEKYYKTKLVPFSERVPFSNGIPFLYRWSKKLIMDIGDYTPGDSIVVFNLTTHANRQKLKFSVNICFESIFPFFVRKFVKKGAQFLVVITNDGWFGNTSGPRQHAQIGILRAIENRVWIARCANTGISELIDPYGRIYKKTRFGEEAVLKGSLLNHKGITFFTQYGDLFIAILLLLNGILVLLRFIM